MSLMVIKILQFLTHLLCTFTQALQADTNRSSPFTKEHFEDNLSKFVNNSAIAVDEKLLLLKDALW